MAYSDEGGQIPYLCKAEIAKRAEELLDECWDGAFPINVEAICDYLGVAVVPVKGLVGALGVDAYISADFKTIYVEQQGYEDESYRYRFSLAHELGHLVLHREYFSSRVDGFEEWKGLVLGKMNGCVEFQANYFAGSLLAPEGELVGVMNKEFDGSFARNCWNKSHGEFRHILYEARRFFMVSEQVLARRMCDVFPGAEGFDEIAGVIR